MQELYTLKKGPFILAHPVFVECAALTAYQFHLRFARLLFCEQKACFQLVMMSDYRSGRTYVMFNYNNIGWYEYIWSAQGYQTLTSSFRLYTSYSDLSLQLPSLTGNRGEIRNCVVLGLVRPLYKMLLCLFMDVKFIFI